jgi:hypothetical protein
MKKTGFDESVPAVAAPSFAVVIVGVDDVELGRLGANFMKPFRPAFTNKELFLDGNLYKL